MPKKKTWMVILLIVVVAVLTIGVPFAINEAYKVDKGYVTMWGAEDVLSYYGTILAAVGAVLGVFLSIKAAHKNYEDDVRARVLPFIAVTPFERKAVVNTMALLEEETKSNTKAPAQNEKAVIYEEFKLDRVYFVITSDGIKSSRALDKRQQKILDNAGTVWMTLANGVHALQYVDYFSIPIEIENVGNGTAVALRIGFNRNSNTQPKYIRPMMLKQGQTVYIHIFSEEAFDIVDGNYMLEFYYEDIYGNKYVQKFPVRFGKDDAGKEYQSIELVGKQIRREGDAPNAHP